MNFIQNKKIRIFLNILKSFLNKKPANKGFSLIELLVVLAIMVILVAIGVPAYQSYKKKSEETALMATLKSLNKSGLVLDATEQTINPVNVAQAVKGVDSSELKVNYVDSYSWCVEYKSKCINEEGDIDDSLNKCDRTGNCK